MTIPRTVPIGMRINQMIEINHMTRINHAGLYLYLKMARRRKISPKSESVSVMRTGFNAAVSWGAIADNSVVPVSAACENALHIILME